MTSPELPPNGLLVVDKPGLAEENHAFDAPVQVGRPPVDESTLSARLLTSHDVVQSVRRLARQKRIGHTGTLDPMASGVLVLCLGWATRLVEYYQGHAKEYRADIRLGLESETGDVLGAVAAVAPVPALDAAAIEAALNRFRGEVQQTPPVYSALKQGGESLHRKARRGETVLVAPRTVVFHKLDLLAFIPPDRIELRVRCSAGAYVRSLAVDLARALGTLGVLAGLRREAAGHFVAAQAQTLPEIEAAAAEQRLHTLLLAPGEGLEMPALVVDAADAHRLGQGQRVLLQAPSAPPPPLLLARNPAGELLGILRPTDEAIDAPLWRADKWFGG